MLHRIRNPENETIRFAHNEKGAVPEKIRKKQLIGAAPESAACNKGSETADTEAESETAESEEEDAEKESCADREVSPQEESEVTTE